MSGRIGATGPVWTFTPVTLTLHFTWPPFLKFCTRVLYGGKYWPQSV